MKINQPVLLLTTLEYCTTMPSRVRLTIIIEGSKSATERRSLNVLVSHRLPSQNVSNNQKCDGWHASHSICGRVNLVAIQFPIKLIASNGLLQLRLIQGKFKSNLGLLLDDDNNLVCVTDVRMTTENLHVSRRV